MKSDFEIIQGSESRNAPYFEPLTSDGDEREKKRLPISIEMAGTAGVSIIRKFLMPPDLISDFLN